MWLCGGAFSSEHISSLEEKKDCEDTETTCVKQPPNPVGTAPVWLTRVRI